jgi:16S rRNA (cytosine1402-N4)-methyltransferase
MPRNERYHRPVLADEAVTFLVTRADGIYIDATAGSGGHSLVIASRLSAQGRILAIDRDDEAVAATRDTLQGVTATVQVLRGDFGHIKELAHTAGFPAVSGVLFDLGVSSHQLDSRDRGFSYLSDGPLDLRMDTRGATTADEFINSCDEPTLANVLFEWGGERNSRKIAAAIIAARAQEPIRTTGRLATIISGVTNPRFINKTLSRCFQAIRIAVNDEIGQLETGLAGAFDLLEPGGRLVVISYHSLEDGIVKNFIRDRAVATSGNKYKAVEKSTVPGFRQLTKKPMTPSAAEIASNSRARSAKLRAAEKV